MKRVIIFARRTLLYTLVGLTIMSLTNCTGILTAKFESDTLGGDPDKTLPGNPSGDEMTYVDEVTNQLTIVSTPDYPAQKSLEYRSISPSGSVSPGASWISFTGKSSNFGKPITFVWTAIKNFNPGGPDMYIDITDGSGIMVSRMKILNNGDLFLVTNVGTETGNVIGNIPNGERHTFLLTVNLEEGTYNLSVVKPSENINETNLEVLANITSFHNPARPSVSFKYKNYGIGQQYLVDEVLINKKN